MQGISRRRLLGYGLAAGAAVAIPWAAWPSAGYAWAGGKLAKYVQQVPLIGSGIVVARQSAPNVYSFSRPGSAGSCIPISRRRRSGPMTTAPAWPDRPAPSAWRWSRRPVPR